MNPTIEELKTAAKYLEERYAVAKDGLAPNEIPMVAVPVHAPKIELAARALKTLASILERQRGS